MGRKKRCAYWINATSTPSVTVPRTTSIAAKPDHQAIATDDKQFDDRVVERIGQDGVFEGLHVLR